jgi:hypothetical protein
MIKLLNLLRDKKTTGIFLAHNMLDLGEQLLNLINKLLNSRKENLKFNKLSIIKLNKMDSFCNTGQTNV